MSDYTVHIYKIGIVTQTVHLSNPALYVASDSDRTVTFSSPNASDSDSWTITFPPARTPFTAYDQSNGCTTTARKVATLSQTGKSGYTVCVLKGTDWGDYNYAITIDNSVSEDPQVIVGGRGSTGGFMVPAAFILSLLAAGIATVMAVRARAAVARLRRGHE